MERNAIHQQSHAADLIEWSQVQSTEQPTPAEAGSLSEPGKPSEPGRPSKLSAQVGAVVFGRIIVSLIDTMKAFLLVRLLTKDDYGALAFALTWQATAIGLGVLGLPDSLMYFLPPAKPGVQKTIVRQTLLMLSGIGLVLGGAIALLAVIPGIQPFARPDMTPALLCIALAVVMDLPASAMQQFLLGTERHRASSLIAMCLSMMANLALLIPAWAGASIVEILLFYNLVALARLSITWGAWGRVFAGVTSEPFEGGIKAQLKFALPLSLNGLAGLVNKYFSTYVVGWLLTAAAFADFAVGGRELPFVMMIPNAVAVAILPQLAKLSADIGGKPGVAGSGVVNVQGRQQALVLWHASIERVALVMLPICVFIEVNAEPLMRVLYGAKYASAALPLRITSAVLLLRVTGYGVMVMALGRPATILRSQLCGMAFNVLATAPLVLWAWRGGADGPSSSIRIAWACLASAIAVYVIVAVMLYDIGKVLGVGVRGAFPWRGYGHRLTMAMLAAMPVIAWRVALPVPANPWLLGASTAGQLLLYAGCYAGLVLAAGYVPPEDRKVLLSWLRLEPLWKRT
jgi:O-antigen/teichoic acid export membrane protein